ncbi:MAG: hypothetical protein H7066_21015, partial [Cytophagaceae bacterium]|nr:hypothetical protein [Gemmatimonadaceae bacterium]
AEKRHAAVAPSPRLRSIGAMGEEPSVEAIIQSPPSRSPVTLGAQGGLLVGSMSDGVQEVWLHPLCVVGGGITVAGPSSLTATSATASSVHLARTLRDSSGGQWREVAFLHGTAPEFVYVLSPVDAVTPRPPDRATIGVEFRMPLRRQWPFPASALVPLRAELRREEARASVLVTGRDGAHVAACFIDGAIDVSVIDDESAPMVRAIAAPGATLRLVVRASSSGTREIAPATSDVWGALQERIDALHGLRERATRLSSGDAALDDAWAGACARLANFMVVAPSGGRGLVAGYAGSRSGWNVSRPGYAWFFGRDACWTIDALLAVGLFAEARDAITLLAQTMDVTGKVFHELTISGVAHYDAADSTPLFLRAVGAYAEWTGDVDALTAWWPHVLRAFAFVEACDRDGDGLPENTGVGHGWIEMGPLGGGAVTSYVAAIWIDALRRLVPVAAHLGDDGTAARMRAVLARAEHAVESLRGPDGVLALHRDAHGRLSSDRTAMATVPIALGVGASSSDHELLRDLASPRFSAPWGLRMLPVDDPRYDPVAYHAGSAWPLFTGWAALADCATGAVDRGLARVQSLGSYAQAEGTGGFAEVLNGDTGARAGVCPDQAWSAAMILTPIVRGVAGLVPDALNGRCTIRARVPSAAGTLRLHGVRVGETRFDLHWARADGECSLIATHREGPSIELDVPVDASARETTRGSGRPLATSGGMLRRSDGKQWCSRETPISWTVPDEGPR